MYYCTYAKKMNMELNKLLVLFRSWCRQTLVTFVASMSVDTYAVLQFIPNIRICWLYKVLYIFELISFCAI